MYIDAQGGVPIPLPGPRRPDVGGNFAIFGPGVGPETLLPANRRAAGSSVTGFALAIIGLVGHIDLD